MKKILLSVFCLFFLTGIYQQSQAQITVVDGPDIADVLQELLGDGVTISNITIDCRRSAYGSYVSTDPSLALTSGLLITSGSADDAVGPNNSGSTGTNNNFPGDPDLTALAGLNTFDACIVEFDVVPIGDEIWFNYTFGSEEYPEFTPCAGQNINDAFAFYVDGPNPNGGTYANENIAIIPGTTLPVSINNVNQCTNTAYYQGNNGNTLEYDGYTVDLVAKIEVVPCETYRFKLKIADGADGIYDSGVFIENLNSNSVEFNASLNTSTDFLIEGCTQSTIEVPRTGNIDRPANFELVYEGTATNGVDYTALPTSVDFAPGEASKTLVLEPLNDGDDSEGIETVTIYIKPFCSEDPIDSVVYEIYDQNSVEVIPDAPAEVFYCGSNTISFEGGAADSYTWSSPDGGTFDCLDADCKDIEVTSPNATHDYTLTMEIGPCTFSQTVTVAPSILTISSDVTICEGESITLNAGGRETYTWTSSPTDNSLSCVDAECSEIIVAPTQNTTYTVQGVQGNCDSEESVTVTVVPVGNAPDIVGLRDNLKYCTDEDIDVTVTGNPTGGTFTVNGTPVGATYTFNPSVIGAGTQNILYVIGTGGSCSEQNTKIVSISNPPLSSDLAILDVPALLCADDANTYTPQGQYQGTNETGVFSLFKDGAEINANLSNLSPSNLANNSGTGIYTLRYTYTNTNSTCSNFTEINFDIKPLPTAAFSGDTESGYCLDTGTRTLNLLITNADGSSNTQSFSFDPATLGVGSHSIVSQSYQDPNTNCEIEINYSIEVFTPPTVSILPLLKDSYCGVEAPEEVNVSINGTNQTANSLDIRKGASLVQSNQTLFAPEQLLSDFGQGDFTLVFNYQDANGCSAQAEFMVNIAPNPDFALFPKADIELCPKLIGEPLAASPTQRAGAIYRWTKDGEADYADSYEVIINDGSDEGLYEVEISDGDGCPVEKRSYQVVIECTPSFNLANAFSPNGDGLNDTFSPFGGDFVKLDWRIYNRWGHLVFTGDDGNLVWDGRLNGKDVPAGTYLWTATYENILEPGVKISKKGHVTVIR